MDFVMEIGSSSRTDSSTSAGSAGCGPDLAGDAESEGSVNDSVLFAE
jgi:hypothetical protein